MDKKEQEKLLSDTIGMVMSCLHHHQDEDVKYACRQFLNEFEHDWEEEDQKDDELDDLHNSVS